MHIFSNAFIILDFKYDWYFILTYFIQISSRKKSFQFIKLRNNHKTYLKETKWMLCNIKLYISGKTYHFNFSRRIRILCKNCLHAQYLFSVLFALKLCRILLVWCAYVRLCAYFALKFHEKAYKKIFLSCTRILVVLLLAWGIFCYFISRQLQLIWGPERHCQKEQLGQMLSTGTNWPSLGQIEEHLDKWRNTRTNYWRHAMKTQEY